MCAFRYLEAEGTEKTFRFKQEDIAAAVPVANSQQVCGVHQHGKLLFNTKTIIISQYFDLNLDTFGPYSISYSRHGR